MVMLALARGPQGEQLAEIVKHLIGYKQLPRFRRRSPDLPEAILAFGSYRGERRHPCNR